MLFSFVFSLESQTMPTSVVKVPSSSAGEFVKKLCNMYNVQCHTVCACNVTYACGKIVYDQVK